MLNVAFYFSVMLNIIMLNVVFYFSIMLNDVVLSVIMLNVVMLSVAVPKYWPSIGDEEKNGS